MRHQAMKLGGKMEACSLSANPDFYPVMTAIIAHAGDLWNKGLDAQPRSAFASSAGSIPGDTFSITRMMETRSIAVAD